MTWNTGSYEDHGNFPKKANAGMTDILLPDMVMDAADERRLPKGVALFVTLILSGSLWAVVIHLARTVIG